MEQKINLQDVLFKFGTAREYSVNKFFKDSVLQKEYYSYQFDSAGPLKNYGLIYNDRPYLPKNKFLKTYQNNNGESQKNLLFIVDAFQDMKKHHQNYLKTNKFNINGSKYVSLNVVSSTLDLNSIFVEYLNAFSDVFLFTYLTEEKRSKILNIHNFLDQLIMFIKNIKPILTKSSFINSRRAPLQSNGLTISFDNGNLFDVLGKTNYYISDPNFDTFLDSAKRFGFFIDKNAPWRMVADLESPVMVDYIKKYGIVNTADIFKKLYNPAHLDDLEVNRVAIISFWNAYVKEFGFNSKTEKLEGCSKLFTSITNYSLCSEEIFNYYFNTNWQLRFLLYCKINELELKINQKKFERMFFDILNINSKFGLNDALNYLYDQIIILQKEQIKNLSDLTNPSVLDTIKKETQKNIQESTINF